MTDSQIVLVAATFVILLLITLAAQFHWLGEGRTKTVLVLLSGIAAMLSLRMAELPPSWFSASKTGFALGLTLTIGAFLGRTTEERSFRFPLLLGMGGTLLVANAVEFVRQVL